MHTATASSSARRAIFPCENRLRRSLDLVKCPPLRRGRRTRRRKHDSSGTLLLCGCCFVTAAARHSAFAARPLRDTVNAMNAPADLAHPPAQLLAERIPLEGSGAVDVERQRAVVARLRSFLPEHCVLWREEDTKPYECDGLTLYRQLPMVVALPEDEAQVVDIVRACHELGVPVVPRGAGTGLSGGALPHGKGVLLSLAKFNRILHDRSARAHGDRAAGRAQRRDFRGGRASRPVLRPGSIEPDRLHHRRQHRRELRRRALPEVRPHAAQRAARARRHDRGRHRRSRLDRSRQRRATTCCRWWSAPKACCWC